MKRAWIWPASLLFGATLVLGVVSFFLLARESNRLREINLSAVEEQSQAVAENILLTVAEIKSALMDGLLEFEGELVEQKLAAWVEENPLAEFAFVWQSEADDSLAVLPRNRFKLEAHQLLGSETGAWLWQETPTIDKDFADKAAMEEAELAETFASTSWDGGAPAPTADLASSSARAPVQNYFQNLEERQIIRQQSKESSRAAKQRFELPQRWSADSTDWYAKRVLGQAYLVGVARWQAGSVVTGVAVRMESIRSSLSEAFPSRILPHVSTFSIMDDAGNFVLGSSKTYTENSEGRQPLVKRLDSELPGWTLQTRLAPTSFYADAFLVLAGGTLAILLLCLCTAGLWLAWQSRSSLLEAARKATFVSNVSHELKTPLTTIRMYAELIHEGRVVDEGKRNQYLDTIVRECQRLSRLVNNVLDFSRLERGKARLESRQQPLIPAINRYLDMRRAEIAEAGFSVDTLFPDRVVLAYFDSDALSQVLGNLIDNALKYAKNGQWLGIDLRSDRKWVILCVRDRGPGLPPERQGKLFKPFERGDSSLVASQSGFGLGLNIAHNLVSKMKGRLSYQRDAETGGACFEIKLRQDAP